MKLVIFAVATDDAIRSALGAVLRRRYGSDYSVAVADHPASGLRQLAAYRDAGEQVALLLARCRMTDRDGIPFLIEATRTASCAARRGAARRIASWCWTLAT